MFIFKLFLIALLACILEGTTEEATEGVDAKNKNTEVAREAFFRFLNSEGGGRSKNKGQGGKGGVRAKPESIGKFVLKKAFGELGSEGGIYIANKDLAQCIGTCLTAHYGENPEEGEKRKAGPRKPAANGREEPGSGGERHELAGDSSRT